MTTGKDIQARKPITRRTVLKGAATAGLAASLPHFAIAQQRPPLSFWIMDSQNEAPVSGILADFTEDTGIEVDLQVVPWSNVFSRWTTSFEAGTGADVSQCGGMGLFPAIYWDQGHLLDLSDVLEDLGADNYFSSEWGLYDGGVTSVPWFLETRVLWYRKDWFDEAGLAPPSTWDELQETATALTEGRRFGIALPFIRAFFTGQSNFTYYLNVDEDASGTLAQRKSDGTLEVTLDKPRFVEALNRYTYFDEAGVMPPGTTAGDSQSINRLFNLGVAGMIFGNGSVQQQIAAEAPQLLDEDRVGTVTIPGKMGPGYSFLGGSGLWVNKATERPDEAKALLLYLNRPASQVALAKAGMLNQPSALAAQDAPELTSDPHFVALSKQLEKTKAYLWKVGPEPRLASFYGNNVMEKPVLDVVVDGVSAEEATERLEGELHRYLVD
ncbi:extracellular solute-binding protein [Bauldia sp.]|uniref:extracellular solute-binding protein n=1 Tax=Bauldia sp. TaxID=2575872 RepID=UPI003BA96AA7